MERRSKRAHHLDFGQNHGDQRATHRFSRRSALSGAEIHHSRPIRERIQDNYYTRNISINAPMSRGRPWTSHHDEAEQGAPYRWIYQHQHVARMSGYKPPSLADIKTYQTIRKMPESQFPWESYDLPSQSLRWMCFRQRKSIQWIDDATFWRIMVQLQQESPLRSLLKTIPLRWRTWVGQCTIRQLDTWTHGNQCHRSVNLLGVGFRESRRKPGFNLRLRLWGRTWRWTDHATCIFVPAEWPTKQAALMRLAITLASMTSATTCYMPARNPLENLQLIDTKSPGPGGGGGKKKKNQKKKQKKKKEKYQGPAIFGKLQPGTNDGKPTTELIPLPDHQRSHLKNVRISSGKEFWGWREWNDVGAGGWKVIGN